MSLESKAGREQLERVGYSANCAMSDRSDKCEVEVSLPIKTRRPVSSFRKNATLLGYVGDISSADCLSSNSSVVDVSRRPTADLIDQVIPFVMTAA